MSTEIVEVVGRLAAIKLEVHIWSGRKKLRPEDLKKAGDIKLPPEELASLGSKKIVDPERLNVFHRLKKEAERTCLQVGTRFLGGFAIPDEKLAEVLKDLDRIRTEFLQERAKFLAEYGQAVDEWASRYPEFESIIRAAVDPVEHVGSVLDFDYVVFRVEPHPQDQKSLGKAADHLGHGALDEVAKEADKLLEQSLLGKNKVSRRVLSPLKRIRDKLDGLSFLDASFGPIVDSIDQLLRELENTAPIQGRDLDRLMALVQILADPAKARKHGSGLLSFSDFMPLADFSQSTNSEQDNTDPPEIEAESIPDPNKTAELESQTEEEGQPEDEAVFWF